MTAIAVRPLSGAVGAEIDGVDLASVLSDETFAAIYQAFSDHGVLVFRDQTLTELEHTAFALRWGEININRFFKAVDGHPTIAEVRKEPDQQVNIGHNWHADHSYDSVPALGSILYAREVPDFGGDTLFASMYRAYETLSPGLQRTLEGLKAFHTSRHVFGNLGVEKPDTISRVGNADLATQEAVHPVVIRHPISGRKALYVNPEFTVHFDGWSKEESQPLLNFLYKHACTPDFTCRIRWEKGSLAIWDNRSTWHCALNDYPGRRRLMHRITVEGALLTGAADIGAEPGPR